MAKIKNIIFDFGGVLLNLDISRTEKAFVEMGVTDFKTLFALGHADSFFKLYETGDIDDDTFVAKMMELTQNRFDSQTLTSAWNAMLLDFPPERVELLDELKKNFRLFLFSNTNAIHYKVFSEAFEEKYGRKMASLFEKAYYSHIIRLRKPGREGFDYILDDARLIPEETVFIDDALVNLEGAALSGMRTIHLLPGQTILDLNLTKINEE
ncbi:MAG TPA: HAD family phosphatase [Parasegetibacter sp.]|jgi:HAD superfamily hydrolase (TIGR01509 family)